MSNTKTVELIGDEVLTVKRGDDDFLFVSKDSRGVLFSVISFLAILRDDANDFETKSNIQSKMVHLLEMLSYGFKEE